jgi:hypothetical protein
MENQEKHKEIYKLTGVEPRYWRGYVYVGIAQVDMAKNKMRRPKPHYPCEQLWEMLRPLVDIVSWDMYFIVLQYRKNNQGGLKQIMPNISVTLTQEQIKDLEYLMEVKNQFLRENDIPLEVSRSGVMVDLLVREVQKVKDIYDNRAS